MNDKIFVYVTLIKATPEKIWEALTHNEFINDFWFGSSFETDWKVGSEIKEIRNVDQPGFHGEILVADAPKRLSYTFIAGKDETETKVDIELDAEGDVVKLTLTHTGYHQDSDIYRSISYGWAGIFSSLKTLVETGEPIDRKSVEQLFAKSMSSGK